MRTYSPWLFRSRLLAAALALLAGSLHAEIRLTPDTAVAFATVEQGRAVLARTDEYVDRMSAFDRMLRLRSAQAVSKRQYLDNLAANVLPWRAEDRESVGAAVRELASLLEGLRLPLPQSVLLVKTTGDEEVGIAHTRANAIVLPQPSLEFTRRPLADLLAHELFHVMTRHDPVFRERAYRLVGFRVVPEIALPPALEELRFTNPDAPTIDVAIDVSVDGTPFTVAPVLLSRSPVYDAAFGIELDDYWTMRLLALERDERTGTKKPLLADGEPRLFRVREVSGFFERIGRNTRYIIHPEEIMADNFSLLLFGGEIRNPEIVEGLRALLSGHAD
ncbi:MAG TPA: hypothetical protein VMP00_15070 [Burkholderiales bacterium]|nr:hypothetical protein [Burkholderiales bacterium]